MSEPTPQELLAAVKAAILEIVTGTVAESGGAVNKFRSLDLDQLRALELRYSRQVAAGVQGGPVAGVASFGRATQ